MEVKHLFSKKRHFFEVKSGDNVYTVSIHANCDCKYMSIVGIPNGKLCKHIKAVLKEIVENETV